VSDRIAGGITRAHHPTQGREEGVVLKLSASDTDDDSPAARWLRRSAQASVAALFAVMIVSAAAYVKLSYASDRLPYPLDYGEGVMLYQASRLASFSRIYPADVNTPPYFSTNYPPLFAAMQAPLVNLFGPAYWYGRLISQIGLLIVALCLGATVWLLTGKRVAAVATTLLVPAVPVFAVWSQYNRVDSVALALTWMALVLLVRSRARWRIPLVALLLAASAFTRQSYALAGPVAALAVILSGNDTRAARSFAMWFVGLGTVSALALEWVTRGGFLRHVIIDNVGAVAVHNLWDEYGDLGVTIPVLLGCAAAVMFGRVLPPRGRALARAYLLCAAFTSLLIVKVGSDVNYVYELAAGCVLAAGLIFALALRRPITTVVAALVLAGQVATLAATRPYERIESRVRHAADSRRLLDLVCRIDGPILADEAMGFQVIARKAITFEPFEMTQLARQRRWNDQALVQMVRNHAFAAILIFTPASGNRGLIDSRWTPRLQDAIGSSYLAKEHVPIEDSGYVVVYRPRSMPG
jgi:hypothetical protein